MRAGLKPQSSDTGDHVFFRQYSGRTMVLPEELKGEGVFIVGAFLHLSGTSKEDTEVWKNVAYSHNG